MGRRFLPGLKARVSTPQSWVNPPVLPGMTGDWIVSFQAIDQAGRAFNAGTVRACLGSNFEACQSGLGARHLRDVIAYQPASRFWAFQWCETGIFLAVAVALGGFCVWWLSRHRLA